MIVLDQVHQEMKVCIKDLQEEISANEIDPISFWRDFKGDSYG